MEERDVMPVDVLFVGGGVACLSGALHLANLIKAHNEKIEKGGDDKKLDEIGSRSCLFIASATSDAVPAKIYRALSGFITPRIKKFLLFIY